MRKKDLGLLLIITFLISFIFGAICSSIILINNSSDNNSFNIVNTSVSMEEDNSINEGISKIYDAVVVIEGFKNDQMNATGTGFIYKKDDGNAYVMTNHHVVGSSDKLKIILSDKTELDATLAGSEVYSDIAVLKVSSDKIKQVAKIGNSNKLKVGDILFAVGSPEGADYAGTVTKGILSGKDRLVEVAFAENSASDYYMKVLQTDAAINPGNSGGPICDVNGNVVGITNMKLVDSTVEGMGFAIPIEDALNYAAILEKGDKIIRPYVGISMMDVSNDYYLWQNRITIPSNIKSGVVIIEVSKDSPASKANFKKGDIIVKLNNKTIRSVAEFRYQLYKYKPGDTIKVTYVRDNKEKKVDIKLGKMDKE